MGITKNIGTIIPNTATALGYKTYIIHNFTNCCKEYLLAFYFFLQSEYNSSYGRENTSIDAYLHPSMMKDPWAHLRKDKQ